MLSPGAGGLGEQDDFGGACAADDGADGDRDQGKLLICFNFKTNTRSSPFFQVEDDGTAIAEAVRNVMNLTFDPISKQPFFVGMTKMCHQVGSKGLRDAEVEILFCSNTSAQIMAKTKALRS